MSLITKYRSVRSASMEIARYLSPEDCQIQSMPDASPIKWHLGHTTWFIEHLLCDLPQGELPGHAIHRRWVLRLGQAPVVMTRARMAAAGTGTTCARAAMAPISLPVLQLENLSGATGVE